MKSIYDLRDLPMEELEKLGLATDNRLNLDKEDLRALLEGRRTSMQRLENLNADGITIPALDAKISLRQNAEGNLELMLHPIYKEAIAPEYLTGAEAEKLEKGEAANYQKMIFDDEGQPKEVLIEFDRDTNEFIVTDTERITPPDYVNGEKLTEQQQADFRHGRLVELLEGTRLRYSAVHTASLLNDGGITYLLFKGLHALLGEKHDKNAELMSKGYEQAVKDMVQAVNQYHRQPAEEMER